MTITEIFSVAGTILATFGGGALIVLALSKWLGGVWANRILENEKFKLQLKQDLLMRRRDIYAKLAIALRVFLNSSEPTTPAQKDEFLSAHDEAFLWASEEVCQTVAAFLDLQVKYKGSQDPAVLNKMVSGYQNCLFAMRKDSDFPDSSAQIRVVSF